MKKSIAKGNIKFQDAVKMDDVYQFGINISTVPMNLEQNYKNAKIINCYLNLIERSQYFEKIVSENGNILDEIELLFEECSIFGKIQEIFKLQKVKRIYLLNLVGDTINSTLSMQNQFEFDSCSFSIPNWEEMSDLNRTTQIFFQDNSHQNYFGKPTGTKQIINSDLASTNSDNLFQTEDDFLHHLKQMENKLIHEFQNHHNNGNFKEFFQKLKQKIDTDTCEVKKKLFSIFVSLIIVAANLLDLEIYSQKRNLNSRSKLNEVFGSSINDNQEAKLRPISESIDFSRRLYVPEFNTNIISIRLSDILKSKPDIELNENEKICCKFCDSYFYEMFSKNNNEQNNWSCQFCDNENTLLLNNKEKKSYFDVEYKKNTIKECSFLKRTESKIFIICMDISGSMSGSRIDIVKKASIKALVELKNKTPDYRVALISFQSETHFYGDGNSDQVIFHNFINLDKIEIIDEIRKKSSSLRPIRESFNSLVNKINNLSAGGGTRLSSALIESVILASTDSNSEIILCTDGEAEDSSMEFYEKIANFCNLSGFIKINIITFPDSCQLKSLGYLSSATEGSLEKLSNSDQFDKSFVETAKRFIEVKKSQSVKLVVLAQKNIILEDRNNSKYENDMIDSNKEEILIKYEPKDCYSNQKEFFFQFQIETNNSIRVITKKLKNETRINEKLIFAYSIRKISNFILESKNSDAKNYAENFFNYMESSNCKSQKAEEIINEVKEKWTKKTEDDIFYQLVHNSKKIKSDDILLVYTKANKIKNEYFDEFEKEENFEKFKIDIENIFDGLNLEQYGINHRISIYKLLVSTKLIKESLKIINFLAKDLEITTPFNLNFQIEKIEDIFKIITDQIKPFILLNKDFIDKNIEDSHLSDLILNLNKFFQNSVKQDAFEKSLKNYQSLRLKMIDFSINNPFYDFEYEEIDLNNKLGSKIGAKQKSSMENESMRPEIKPLIQNQLEKPKKPERRALELATSN